MNGSEIKQTHTPGPWALNEVRTSCGRAFRIGSGEMLSAGKGCCIIYDDYPGAQDNERSANARLISVAPDLYEALKALDDAYCVVGPDMTRDQRDQGRKALIAARAAIAKAEGH